MIETSSKPSSYLKPQLFPKLQLAKKILPHSNTNQQAKNIKKPPDSQYQSQKKSHKSSTNSNIQHNIRQVISQNDNIHRQNKPFQKKYLQAQIPNINQQQIIVPKSRQSNQGDQKQKKYTKDAFHEKLAKNMIKDDQVQRTPGSKSSYRVRKVDTRSPKKIRQDLISYNQQEQLLQKQIFDYHAKTKNQLLSILQKYHLKKKHISQSQYNNEDLLKYINEKINNQNKQLNSIGLKIQKNNYYIYISNPQKNQDIVQSQEEDQVHDLPGNSPKIDPSMGSYSSAMKQIRDKKHNLNMRRTYDIFKQQVKQSRVETVVSKLQHEQENQNRMTVNSRFKDFLLN